MHAVCCRGHMHLFQILQNKVSATFTATHRGTASHRTTLHHTAPHCNTLHHTRASIKISRKSALWSLCVCVDLIREFDADPEPQIINNQTPVQRHTGLFPVQRDQCLHTWPCSSVPMCTQVFTWVYPGVHLGVPRCTKCRHQCKRDQCLHTWRHPSVPKCTITTATHCNTLQHTATHATHWWSQSHEYHSSTGGLVLMNTSHALKKRKGPLVQDCTHQKETTSVSIRGGNQESLSYEYESCTATHCNTLQHTATHCNTQ